VLLDIDCLARVEAPMDVQTWPGGVGFFAEDAETVVPEAVSYNRDTTLFGITYGNMVGYLWGAVRELSAQVRALQAAQEGQQPA
jgi:hypothetical protein